MRKFPTFRTPGDAISLQENPEPPRALAGDLFGGTPQWHGPDPEIVTACDSNSPALNKLPVES